MKVRSQNNSLKPTAYACHALCRKGKARATRRRLSSTVRLSKNLI